jgi:FlaA1/EpsC-like NDP-sugar epimerase
MSLENSVILITGGTGSLGSRVAAHLLKRNVKQVIIYSRDEKKQVEMQKSFPHFRYIIGDIRDLERLKEAMVGVDYVFHAAAIKHVPHCESCPYEVVKTNIVGSHNVCQAAEVNGIKTMVAFSTDKAVKPVSTMGISKAMMEKIICTQNLYEKQTTFCCVRCGNLMGSRGSVIPIFRKQIEADEPITITVPYMTRFLMTLDQSVDLVFHAMSNAKGGEIFVKKTPACTVQALAEAMRVKYSNKGVKHPIKVIGIRPGEKIHEILVNEYEMQRLEEFDSYLTIYPEYKAPKTINPQRLGKEYTSHNTIQLKDYFEIGHLIDQSYEL